MKNQVKPPARRELVELAITKMTLGSGGLAYFNGKVVFVPYTMPGDRVRAYIHTQKKNHAFAKVQEWVQPSADRQAAPCPYFMQCGGCQWQQIPYLQQLQYKQDLVYGSWRHRMQRFPELPAPVYHSIKASPEPWGYRHRIRLKRRKGQWGYFQAGSHVFVPIKNCLIADPVIQKEFKEQQEQQVLKKQQEQVDQAGPRSKPLSRWPDGDYEWQLKGSSVEIVPLGSPQALAFTQVNPFINETIGQTLKNWVQSQNFQKVVDLYCGQGNLTFAIEPGLPSAAQILGIEVHAQSVQRAQFLAQDKGLEGRVRFTKVEATQSLPLAQKFEPQLLMLDPPRAGLPSELIEQVCAWSQLQAILYMSCDPMTLQRDLELFIKRGWWVEQFWLFDMFPQTDHVESLVLLRPL